MEAVERAVAVSHNLSPALRAEWVGPQQVRERQSGKALPLREVRTVQLLLKDPFTEELAALATFKVSTNTQVAPVLQEIKLYSARDPKPQ